MPRALIDSKDVIDHFYCISSASRSTLRVDRTVFSCLQQNMIVQVLRDTCRLRPSDLCKLLYSLDAMSRAASRHSSDSRVSPFVKVSLQAQATEPVPSTSAASANESEVCVRELDIQDFHTLEEVGKCSPPSLELGSQKSPPRQTRRSCLRSPSRHSRRSRSRSRRVHRRSRSRRVRVIFDDVPGRILDRGITIGILVQGAVGPDADTARRPVPALAHRQVVEGPKTIVPRSRRTKQPLK